MLHNTFKQTQISTNIYLVKTIFIKTTVLGVSEEIKRKNLGNQRLLIGFLILKIIQEHFTQLTSRTCTRASLASRTRFGGADTDGNSDGRA